MHSIYFMNMYVCVSFEYVNEKIIKCTIAAAVMARHVVIARSNNTY